MLVWNLFLYLNEEHVEDRCHVLLQYHILAVCDTSNHLEECFIGFFHGRALEEVLLQILVARDNPLLAVTHIVEQAFISR